MLQLIQRFWIVGLSFCIVKNRTCEACQSIERPSFVVPCATKTHKVDRNANVFYLQITRKRGACQAESLTRFDCKQTRIWVGVHTNMSQGVVFYDAGFRVIFLFIAGAHGRMRQQRAQCLEEHARALHAVAIVQRRRCAGNCTPGAAP